MIIIIRPRDAFLIKPLKYLVVFVAVCGQAIASDYSIGVLAFSGKDEAIQRWQPTADYLSQHIPDASFNIVPLTHEEFEHAINKDELDFVLTNPGHYVLLEVRFGITRLATFLSTYKSKTLKRFGSVIFTRADSTLTSLSEIRGHSLAAVSEQAFGGFQLALLELDQIGINVKDDVSIKWMGFPHADVVRTVMDGKTDVGTVRTGIIEKMVAGGVLDLSDVRVLGMKNVPDFPLLHSTALHPEWPFSKLPGTDIELSKQVAIQLFQMKSNEHAALKAQGSGWTIPLDYSSVHNALRQLQVEPYPAKPVLLSTFLQRYRQWIGPIIVLFFIALLFLIKLVHTNRQLKVAQQSLQKHQLHLEDTVQERTDELLQTNQTLQIEIASHVEAEQILSEGCKSLQALHDIFIRDDLDRQQKLNSIVTSVRQYLGMEFALLSSCSKDGAYQAISLSPINSHVQPPLSDQLSKQAIEEKQILIRDNSPKWKNYICCPVYVKDELYCIIEFSRTNEFQNEDSLYEEKLTSELSLRILNLISQWVGNESRMMQVEKRAAQQHQDVSKRFADLSPREMQVLRLLVQGESTKIMARELNISTKTVDMHRANLLRKTGAKSSTELVQLTVISKVFS